METVGWPPESGFDGLYRGYGADDARQTQSKEHSYAVHEAGGRGSE